jgi:protein involved in polysaccharide export with SLBB domain
VFRELEPLDAQSFLILDDGRSDPFFMTNYRFAGKTIPEIEADLKVLLKEETSLQNTEPERLSITVVPAGELVYMTGQFERPGPVALRIGMTVKEAIASVLGMRITGDTDYALLRRPFRDPVHPETFRVDLNDYTEDIVLLPGDEVYLGRTFLYAVVEYLREYLFGIIPGQLYSLPFGAV